MNFNYHSFDSHFFLDFKFNFNCPAQKIFGIFSSVVVGYFIKKYYFSFSETNKSKINNIQHVVKKNIPYEEKYNQDFDNLKSNDEFNISTETLNQKIASLKDKYKRELFILEEEYAEIEAYYDESDDDDDDDDISNDEFAKSLLNQIYDLQLLLKKADQIEKNALQECYADAKFSLMNYLQNNFILENTPIGNVIMVYNCKKEGFSYYSDKSITNKYLESVCKKYCIQFKCKILFNDVFINEGKLSNFKFLKNEVKNKNKKNAKLSFRSFKEQFSLF